MEMVTVTCYCCIRKEIVLIIIRFWDTAAPTPPLSQHFALSNNQVLMLV